MPYPATAGESPAAARRAETLHSALTGRPLSACPCAGEAWRQPGLAGVQSPADQGSDLLGCYRLSTASHS